MYKQRRTIYLPTHLYVRYVEFNVCVHNVVWKVGTRRRSGYVPVCLSCADVRARLTSRSPFHVGKSVPDPRSFPLRRACESPRNRSTGNDERSRGHAWFAGQRLIVPAACEAFLLSPVSRQMTRYTRGRVIEESKIDPYRRRSVSFAR